MSNDASELIQQQFADGGVIPGKLTGQNAVSKTYVDTQDAATKAYADSLNAALKQYVDSIPSYGTINGISASVRGDAISLNAVSPITIAPNGLLKTINIGLDQSKLMMTAERVTYTGLVTGANNVSAALDSLKQTVDQITSEGDSNAEVAAARVSTPYGVSYPSLQARIDAGENKVKNLGIYNVKDYGLTGNGVTNDSIALQTMANTIPAGSTVYFPAGRYLASANFSKDVDIKLDPNAYVDGSITIRGDAYGRSNTTTATGDWNRYPAGNTTFTGTFSGFAAGDKIVVEPTVLDANYNQCGVDFLTIASVNSTTITTTQGTNFPYNTPKISKISNAVFVTGSLAEDVYTIPGDYTSMFAKGDVIRLENRDATGGVESSKAVFELNRIVDINASQMTLENRLTHAFTNYWIVKFLTVNNVSVSGGFIKEVNVSNAQNLDITHAVFSDIHLQYIYDFSIAGVEFRNIGTPQAFELTFAYNGTVSDVRAKGSRGMTDNACVKYMSCVNVVTNNMVSTDTMSTAQGVYPFYVDYYFTPYKNWNDKLAVSNMTLSGNKNENSPDAWVIGVKNSLFSNMTMYWWPKFDLLYNCNITAISTEKRIILSGIERSMISHINAGAVDMSGCKNSQLTNSYFSGVDNLYLRTVWIRGCQDMDFTSIKIGANNNDSFYVEESNRISIDNCSDGTGTGSSSVALGVNLTGLKIGKNDFSKPISGTTGMAATRHYGVPKAVNFPVFAVGRNGYANKGNVTGDNTEYQCAFDSDAAYFNKDGVYNFTTGTFTVPANMTGKYRMSAQIALSGLANTHTLAELYLKVGATKVQLAYDNLNFAAGSTKTILLKGSSLVLLNAGDTVQCFVKVTGTSKTVTWEYADLGGRFSGELIFAE